LKILVLTKRQYTNKDLLDDQYGRLWEIPFHLASIGHEIKGVCLSYRKRDNYTSFFKPSADQNIEWISFNIFSGFMRYLLCINQLLRKFKPDVILASSDCFHVIWGVVLGKIYKVPCVVDLYDNYESYKLSKITKVSYLYRYALKKADAISCVSKPLKEFLINACQLKVKIEIIGNAINDDLFYSRSMDECRKHFQLSRNIKVIGTAGALEGSRGIANLYRAFESVVQKNHNLYLAVAGKGKRDDKVFQHSNIIDLGVLPYHEVPLFFNMLDIAIICNVDNDFGNFCFPQKANEILACKTPLIAANVGVMADMLELERASLFNPEDWLDLANKIQQQLIRPKVLDIPCITWSVQAEKMENLTKAVVKNSLTKKVDK
jgi:glycosyltransferase involved in cell wall biosynthesis